MAKQKVLIVGGGFGGVKAALELAADERFAVTLLSDRQDFRYYPALYHAATGGRRAGASIPLERIFRDKPLQIKYAEAVSVDKKAKFVTTKGGGHIFYDTLILALGVKPNFFGIKGLDQFAFGIKSSGDAAKLKAHLHQQLLDARRPDLNYVVVGGGPTGVELAGALPHYLKHIVKCHGLGQRKIHVELVEASPRLVPALPKDASRAVARRLRRLGIKLYLGKMVQGEDADSLMVSGRPIKSHTVIWTAGVANHPFFAANGFSLMGHGKVATDIYLQADRDIYVIGDNANTPYSGMAQTALHDAKFVAENLKRQASGNGPKSYAAKRPITVIPVGPNWAVLCWKRLRLYGRLGWWARSAADFEAFKDYEPLFVAARQWLTEFESEEDCPACVRAMVTA